jgi:hypothetical protein
MFSARARKTAPEAGALPINFSFRLASMLAPPNQPTTILHRFLTGTFDFALLHPALSRSNPFQEPDRANNFFYPAKISSRFPRPPRA